MRERYLFARQQRTSAFRGKSESEAGASPKIVIRRKIGNKVDVSVGRTIGVGNVDQKELNAEVHVTPGVSVIGVWESVDSVNSDRPETDYSYGVDLKVQKRFKLK